uniref:Uncharacterized protein n=1 Tax=Picea sitchensis TaxID=3332 RepID=A0A6B9XS85_PICSI|nr:hypothetical protein Q903MT_gene3880 [Picea sitchensis]
MNCYTFIHSTQALKELFRPLYTPTLAITIGSLPLNMPTLTIGSLPSLPGSKLPFPLPFPIDLSFPNFFI